MAEMAGSEQPELLAVLLSVTRNIGRMGSLRPTLTFVAVLRVLLIRLLLSVLQVDKRTVTVRIIHQTGISSTGMLTSKSFTFWRPRLSLVLLLLTGCHASGWGGGGSAWLKWSPFSESSCDGCPSTSGCSGKTGCLMNLHKYPPLMVGTTKMKTTYAARRLAKQHLGFGLQNIDYKAGFEQAFIDVAMGGSGCVPPLAPHKYWKEQGRTTKGHQRAQNWFEGYAAGSQIARSYQDRFLDVATSGDPEMTGQIPYGSSGFIGY